MILLVLIIILLAFFHNKLNYLKKNNMNFKFKFVILPFPFLFFRRWYFDNFFDDFDNI